MATPTVISLDLRCYVLASWSAAFSAPPTHGYEATREAAMAAFSKSHACGGVVSNGCCDVSSPSGTLFEVLAAPPPKLAIACTS